MIHRSMRARQRLTVAEAEEKDERNIRNTTSTVESSVPVG